MAHIDKEYHKLLQEILDKGRWYEDPNRNGVKRLQIPRYTFEYDLRQDFPAITTKKLYWKAVVGELLWFLRGNTSPKYLIDNNINIWNKDGANFLNKQTGDSLSSKEYAKKVKEGYLHGDLGRIYGAQWRNWQGGNIFRKDLKVDQISNLIKNLKENPLSTSHIVTAWNPSELNNMALPPCHKGFQIMVYPLTQEERFRLCSSGDRKQITKAVMGQRNQLLDEIDIPKYGFDLVWEQRSVDTFLGLPFNIASYALLAHIIGKMVNMVPGMLYPDLRNVHIYDNAIDAVKKQLSKDVNKYNGSELEFLNNTFELYNLNHNGDIDWLFENSLIEDFKLKNYKSYPSIKAEMLSRNK